MSDMIKIAVDAMGGDGSPKKVIDGILHNHLSNKNIFFKIFGDKSQITQLIDGKINNEFFIRLNKLSGQALHAKTLGFTNPRTKKWMNFNSELPEGFKKILNLLENLSS